MAFMPDLWSKNPYDPWEATSQAPQSPGFLSKVGGFLGGIGRGWNPSGALTNPLTHIGMGILANNQGNYGSGMAALGKGFQQGIQSYQQTKGAEQAMALRAAEEGRRAQGADARRASAERERQLQAALASPAVQEMVRKGDMAGIGKIMSQFGAPAEKVLPFLTAPIIEKQEYGKEIRGYGQEGALQTQRIEEQRRQQDALLNERRRERMAEQNQAIAARNQEIEQSDATKQSLVPLLESSGLDSRMANIPQIAFKALESKLISNNPKLTDVSNIRKEYTSRSEPFNDMAKYYQNITDATEKGIGDLAVIFNIAKMFDPQSVVREGEAETLRQTGSIPEQVMSLYDQVSGGRKLGPKARKDIEDLAGVYMRERLQEQKALSEVYGGISDRAGVNRLDVTKNPLVEKIEQKLGRRASTQGLPQGWSVTVR